MSAASLSSALLTARCLQDRLQNQRNALLLQSVTTSAIHRNQTRLDKTFARTGRIFERSERFLQQDPQRSTCTGCISAHTVGRPGHSCVCLASGGSGYLCMCCEMGADTSVSPVRVGRPGCCWVLTDVPDPRPMTQTSCLGWCVYRSVSDSDF